MSDAPEDEAAPAAKTPRKRPARRATKTVAAAPAETVVQLSAPEPMASEPASSPAPSPAPAPAPAASVEPPVERIRPPRQDDFDSRSQRQDDSDSFGDPVATFGEPPSSDSQGSGKKRRRRKKNKHGQGQQTGGGSQQIFQTAPTQGFSSSSHASAPSGPEERREASQPEGHQAPAMQAVQRPKLDYDQVAKKAWKIFLAEVSEEGLALIGDNDARELSRRSFRLAEVFVEEATRRQHR